MSEVFELRQYTLHPGQRETLIELFTRELVAPQEACGMRIIATFRDLGDPDRFVWIRGFADMAARREALTCFYGGPVWKAHRNAANATMIDSDDVLLLRLVSGSQFPVRFDERVYLTVYTREAFDGAPALTLLETEHAQNDYPALPVRAGEDVRVAITREPARGNFVQQLVLAPT